MRGWLVLGTVAAAVPFFLAPDGYVLRVVTIGLLLAAMGQAWNIVGGLAGQISLGHAAYFGVGAYTSTILLRDVGLSPWIGALVGGALAALAALIISIPILRLRGHYFALATLAFAEVMRLIANTSVGLTGGPGGISVPFSGPNPWMFQFASPVSYYYAMLGALVAVTAVFAWMKHGAIGYKLRAAREREDAAGVVGINVYGVKLTAAVTSAALTGGLGTLSAQFNYFFDPDAIFSLVNVSVKMALVAIIGGVGTVLGPILGAFFLLPIEEYLNFAFGDKIAGLSQLVYGLILMFVVLVQPKGLIVWAERLTAWRWSQIASLPRRRPAR